MHGMPDARPDPAELLARANREESSAAQGRLKIFFGMAPGVGKTYAMLAAAQRLAREGVDVVAGIVETHGRTETEQILLGLDLLPRKKIEYHGAMLEEFDLDAALARRPDLLLIDELAHSNVPGSGRREKRWQDVKECLRAGINVSTTLNVQHIESLNDVIAQITGVAVKETVPDWIIDEADEIELVDLPPAVLLDRLKAGKVYMAENAARAVDPSDGFFRHGNLTALRELALRRTAAWVDSDMRRYRADRGIRAVWPAGERILVAVSPSPMAGKLVRAAKRMAAGLHADLLAVYVETARSAGSSQHDRERVVQTLRLAESLGATTTTLAATNAARELIGYARSRNVSRIVVGKTGQSRLRESILGSFVNNLIRESGDIDIYVIRGDTDEPGATKSAPARQPFAQSSGRGSSEPRLRESVLAGSAGAVAIVACATALARAIFSPPDLSEEAMVMLAGVIVVALSFGRAPAILATVLSVLAFNFFFVEPRYTLSVRDSSSFVAFGVMLGAGLIIGSLTARTREQAHAARSRERRTAALYAMSRELAAARDTREVAAVATRNLHDTFDSDAIIAVPAQGSGSAGLDTLAAAGDPDWFDEREQSVARWAHDHATTAGLGTQKLPSAVARYAPLLGSGGKPGVLGLRPRNPEALLESAQLLLLDAFASQIASALERVTLIRTQQSAQLEAERERLRSALLSSVSHDLRTPLASIAGAASTLEQSGHEIDEATRADLTRSIVEESARLNDLIANLVFATRLEAGGITLALEWTTIEEIVGVGLARHRAELAVRPFKVHLPANLPMIRADSAMLPQVIHNLVENALRYTPPGTPISVSAWATDALVFVKVADSGPGLAADEAPRVFQRFYRGRAARPGTSQDSQGTPSTSTRAGMGLGLTICEGIIRAHSGRIWAEQNSAEPPHGVAFLFTLPIERPQPSLPDDLGHERGEAGAMGATP